MNVNDMTLNEIFTSGIIDYVVVTGDGSMSIYYNGNKLLGILCGSPIRKMLSERIDYDWNSDEFDKPICTLVQLKRGGS